MKHKRQSKHVSGLIVVSRPTGFWVTWSDDPVCYVAGPFTVEAVALLWITQYERDRMS